MNHPLPTYKVNKHTLALLSARHLDYQTIALEGDQQFYIRQTPLQLIQRACLEGGSTYDGRRKAVMFLTGAKNKVPIPISPNKQIYAFPTHSPHLFECSWLFQPHIQTISPDRNDRSVTKITFYNEKEIQIPVSYYSIQKQMQRTATCILRFSNIYLHHQFQSPFATPYHLNS